MKGKKFATLWYFSNLNDKTLLKYSDLTNWIQIISSSVTSQA